MRRKSRSNAVPRKPADSTRAVAAAHRETRKGRARHVDWKTLAAEQGVNPIEDFDQFLNEVGGVWPKEESLDDFLVWLRDQRREGREER